MFASARDHTRRRSIDCRTAQNRPYSQRKGLWQQEVQRKSIVLPPRRSFTVVALRKQPRSRTIVPSRRRHPNLLGGFKERGEGTE